ncbi:MAG: hypothetical protein COB53_07360 [Elusimicrobia bacterium]|nr:MAG: hypothetical protein COB53_07360 [Elusimicrobiota bacterium]
MQPLGRILSVFLSLAIAVGPAHANKFISGKTPGKIGLNSGLPNAGNAPTAFSLPILTESPSLEGSLPQLAEVPASVLAAGSHLNSFWKEPTVNALSKIALAANQDPVARSVAEALLTPNLSPETRAALVAHLGPLSAVQVNTLAESLPELARTDRKLRSIMDQLKATIERDGPSLSAETIGRIFDYSRVEETGPAPAPVTFVKLAVPPKSSDAMRKSLNRRHRLKLAAAKLYRPTLTHGRKLFIGIGKLYRGATGKKMDRQRERWAEDEYLFKHGRLRDKSNRRPSKDASSVKELREQYAHVGDVVISAMVGVSGMSFPQLSAQSHLSLLYANLKLAKERNVRILHNTGEGGPAFHIALLENDRETVREEIIRWNIENGQFEKGSWDHAKTEHFIDQLMKSRNALFAEFTDEDMKRIQIVAQFGSALNGIRGPGYTADESKLAKLGKSDSVVVIEYKIKQAAKRGGKVNFSKVDPFVAAERDLAIKTAGDTLKSPEVSPEMGSFEAIAELVRRTRRITGKLVSLKFGVGDPRDIKDLFRYLRDHDALPDFVQIDGRGIDFSPGSGNAPPGANTSLPINEALIVVDAVLKQLGIRELVFVNTAGDILEPEDALERLAFADGLLGARCWMGMGLGCSQMRECAAGKRGFCAYGIASRSDVIAGLALDPLVVGPKAFKAGEAFFDGTTQLMANAGVTDWPNLRSSHGLAAANSPLRIQLGEESYRLDEIYDPQYISDLLRDVMTPEEVQLHVFGGRDVKPFDIPESWKHDPSDSGTPKFIRTLARKSNRLFVPKFVYNGWLNTRTTFKKTLGAIRKMARPASASLHHHLHGISRHYWTARDLARRAFQRRILVDLHSVGDFRGSFGHPVHNGDPEVLSPLIFPEEAYKKIRYQKQTVGRGPNAITLSPMTSYSGMPFEALPVQEHLSLLYAHLKLAEDRQGYTLFNTGKGGWPFYRALLSRDKDAIAQALIEAYKATPGSGLDLEIRHLANEAARMAERVFAEFDDEHLALVNYVAQFKGTPEAADIRALRDDPFAAMAQFNIDADYSDPQGIASFMKSTRRLTQKPVSLRLEVTDPLKLLALLEFLHNAQALPDHLQIDGLSPGSSRGDKTLPSQEGVIAADAILKKLGARDDVYVEATGGIRSPKDAVHAIALGANGVSSGESWRLMAAGSYATHKVGALSSKDILSLSFSIRALSLDPVEEGAKGFLAAANSAKSLVQTLAETGVDDWRRLAELRGLASASPVLPRKQGPRVVPLDRIYTPARVMKMLNGALSSEEVGQYVFGQSNLEITAQPVPEERNAEPAPENEAPKIDSPKSAFGAAWGAFTSIITFVPRKLLGVERIPRSFKEIKKLGWRAALNVFLYYLIRDSILYLIIPYLLYVGAVR